MFAPLSQEWDADLSSGDPLDFPGYAERLAVLGRESVRTGLADGFVLVEGDFDVIGGSMGLVHGEKVVRAFDRATAAGLPVVVVTRSGGARMQEGMVSLVQLARAAAAVARHRAAGLLSISALTSPTTGGVLASYASLTDLRVAEAGATIGFAGPRVVDMTAGEDVSGRSHSAESALEHGLVDAVVPAEDLSSWVMNALGRGSGELRVNRPPTPIRRDPRRAGEGGAWAEVQAARAMGRPSGVHLAARLVTEWTELGSGTDPSLRTGLGNIDGRRVVVVASDRYGGTGRPTPDGYRLARRGVELAGRLGLPLVSLVDMPGAEPGPDAENDGIAAEIARMFEAMATVTTETVSVCVGEGGSGGALALATSDVMLIQEHAIFSVIGPEGAAAILERDTAKAPDVAERLKLTSSDLLRLGIVDAVIPDSIDDAARALKKALADAVSTADRSRRLARFDEATERWLRRPAVT